MLKRKKERNRKKNSLINDGKGVLLAHKNISRALGKKRNKEVWFQHFSFVT